MIVGLLSLQGSPQVQSLITTALQASGLLSSTNVLYYSRIPIPHHNAFQVKSDLELFYKAKTTPNAFVWSLSTANFTNPRETVLDWLRYELFFLVEQWKVAVAKLEQGYDSFGVNLYLSPEPHYEAYCFWMRSEAMNLPRLANPYCAFQSFTNHYLEPFPLSHYQDYDIEQPAPFTDQRLQERLSSLCGVDPDQLSFASLATLLVQSKCYFDPQPTMKSERPYIVNDIADPVSLAFLLPGMGRMDVLHNSLSDAMLAKYKELGWRSNLNFTLQLDQRKADIVYTSLERAEAWIPKLGGGGVIVVKGEYQGKYASLKVGEYSLVGEKSEDFVMI